MADQGLKATLMSGDGITSNELASIAGEAVDGTLMTFPPDPRKQPERRGRRQEVPRTPASSRKPTRCTPTPRCRSSPQRCQGWPANDPQKVAEAIKAAGPCTTVIGDIGFDAKGDITRPDYVMYTWKKGADGKYTYLENK